MNTPRRITVSDIPTTTPDNFIRVEVNYDEGGVSYFSGDSKPRGYYLRITPVQKKDRMVSFTLFSGTGFLLAEATRFNAKHLGTHAANATQHEKYNAALNRVIASSGLVLTTEELAAH